MTRSLWKHHWRNLTLIVLSFFFLFPKCESFKESSSLKLWKLWIVAEWGWDLRATLKRLPLKLHVQCQDWTSIVVKMLQEAVCVQAALRHVPPVKQIRMVSIQNVRVVLIFLNSASRLFIMIIEHIRSVSLAKFTDLALDQWSKRLNPLYIRDTLHDINYNLMSQVVTLVSFPLLPNSGRGGTEWSGSKTQCLDI